MIEQTYSEGRAAHHSGRECHPDASAEARSGWEAVEDEAAAGDRERQQFKDDGGLQRAWDERAMRRELSMMDNGGYLHG
jgi:hypothetical protein